MSWERERERKKEERRKKERERRRSHPYLHSFVFPFLLLPIHTLTTLHLLKPNKTKRNQRHCRQLKYATITTYTTWMCIYNHKRYTEDVPTKCAGVCRRVPICADMYGYVVCFVVFFLNVVVRVVSIDVLVGFGGGGVVLCTARYIWDGVWRPSLWRKGERNERKEKEAEEKWRRRRDRVWRLLSDFWWKPKRRCGVCAVNALYNHGMARGAPQKERKRQRGKGDRSGERQWETETDRWKQ